MKLKSIFIEGMHETVSKIYNFDNFNYLFGNNGAGKSTALQAIQLALLGYVPGGKKTNEAIASHAKGNTLSVTAMLDDNGTAITITRAWMNTGKMVSGSCHIEPESYKIEDIMGNLELPVHNFTEFMGMTANKLKDWFIEFLPSADGDVDWKKELPEALGEMNLVDSELIGNTLKDIESIQADGVEKVRAANTKLKDELSFKKGELQRVQATVQSLVHHDDVSEDSDVDEMKAKIEELSSIRTQLAQWKADSERNASVEQVLTTISINGTECSNDVDYVAHTKAWKAADAKVTELNGTRSELMDKRKAIQMDIASKPVLGNGTCPYTKEICESAKQMVDEINKELEELKLKLTGVESEIKTVDEQIRLQEQLKSEADTQRRAIYAKYIRRDDLMKQLKAIGPCPTDRDDASIAEDIANLQDTIIKVEANKRFNELTDSLTADKFKIESTIEALKVWIKLTDANGLQTKMMTKPFEMLEANMDKYLHPMFGNTSISTKFNLSEKANSFSFGIERNGKYIAFDLLSSGEKCLYTMALLMCLTAESSSALKLILIDDLLDHLDDKNAKHMFEALGKVKDIQLILAGVKPCTGKNADKIVIEVK